MYFSAPFRVSSCPARPGVLLLLQRAASAWRRLSERRRDADEAAWTAALLKAKMKRGRHAAARCDCRPGGLRRELFGTTQRPSKPAPRMPQKQKRPREEEGDVADERRTLAEHSNRCAAPCAAETH